MNQQPDPRLGKRLTTSLPEPVLLSPRFLLWKKVWSPKRRKFLKVPYYLDGSARGGTREHPILLDTPEDLNRLAPIGEVLKAYDKGGYSGIGFALTGEGIGAFDLDACLTPEGDLKPNHPGAGIARAAAAEGAYIAVSPSGQGLRILGPSTLPEAYSKDALEYWGSGRFVTLTGSVWSGAKGWKDLTHHRQHLGELVDRERQEREEQSEVLVTPRLVAELKSALASMSSDERTLWISMGHALKPLGAKGLELWLAWSSTSSKYDEADARAKWDGFNSTRTNHKAVFAEATRNWGWENPRSKKTQDQDDPEPDDIDPDDPDNTRSILDYSMDLGEQVLLPTEFVLDGFLPVGVTLIAGAWGAGKSTNLIPVFASVAHLAPEEWGFHPQLRRHVIWVTEAPDQARDTLYSISKVAGSRSWDDFKKWFHIIPARRKPAKQLARELAQAIPILTNPIEIAGDPQNLAGYDDSDQGVDNPTPLERPTQAAVFRASPVIVLDTTSANLDLENESDNSEVGKAMSALKEKLPGMPIVLVGHTPKAMVRADITDMSFRGAGAWEADAVATYYLVHDTATDMRFMAIRKSRFSPDYTEISFGQEGGRELINTPWGEPQAKTYIHGLPCRSTGEERKAAQKAVVEERKELEKERGLTERQTLIVEAVSRGAADMAPLTRSDLRDRISGKRELIAEALNRLLEAGLVISVPPPEELRERFLRGRMVPEILLPSEIDPMVYFDTLRGQK